MKTSDLLLGAAVIGGGYLLYTQFVKPAQNVKSITNDVISLPSKAYQETQSLTQKTAKVAVDLARKLDVMPAVRRAAEKGTASTVGAIRKATNTTEKRAAITRQALNTVSPALLPAASIIRGTGSNTVKTMEDVIARVKSSVPSMSNLPKKTQEWLVSRARGLYLPKPTTSIQYAGALSKKLAAPVSSFASKIKSRFSVRPLVKK